MCRSQPNRAYASAGRLQQPEPVRLRRSPIDGRLTNIVVENPEDLDLAAARARVAGGHLHRFGQVGAVDDLEAGDLFFGLGERTVGDEKLALPVAHRLGSGTELQPGAADEPHPSGLGLANPGPKGVGTWPGTRQSSSGRCSPVSSKHIRSRYCTSPPLGTIRWCYLRRCSRQSLSTPKAPSSLTTNGAGRNGQPAGLRDEASGSVTFAEPRVAQMTTVTFRSAAATITVARPSPS